MKHGFGNGLILGALVGLVISVLVSRLCRKGERE
jgi:hypothetical protein